MKVEQIKEQLVNAGLTLGSVESFTGGLFASTITSVSGASKFYKGGFVTYATEEKIRLLGIQVEDVARYGVVSKEIAYHMANNARQLLHTDICVSFTGNAGPDAMEGKPVGEIYIGVCAYELARIQKFQLSGSREEIQSKAVELGIEMLRLLLEEKN